MASQKKIQDLINRKQEFIDSQRKWLEKSVVDLQEKLFTTLVSDAISELDTKDGKILTTQRNFRILAQLDEAYETFNAVSQVVVITKLGEGLVKLNELNTEYFSMVTLDDVTSKRFDAIVSKTNKLMASRIGITAEGEVSTGGFLDSFISDNRLLTESKQIVARGITGGMNITDMRNDLKNKIVGIEDYEGGFERYYRQYTYDIYQENDRVYANVLAQEFEMDYAVFTGGLIDDSRDFCRDHNNHVYTREEISKFGEWTYESAQNITSFHDSGSHTGIPSYIAKVPGYDPFVSVGGPNCRHIYRWINKLEAIRLRPELAD